MSIERIPVTDRDQWLKLRQKDITASAAGALLGVHEYVTPFALWALKSGALAEDPEETGPMKRGRLLEPVAMALLAEKQPQWKIERGGWYLRDPESRLGATPDLFVDDPERGRGIVQIKSVESGIFRKKWKDESGEVSPPLWIVVQGILEAYLDGAQWAAVAPLVVGFGLDCPIIDIPIHAGIVDKLKEKTAEFWALVDSKQAPPADYGRDGEILARLYAETNGQILDLNADNALPVLCAEDEELAAAEKAAKDRRSAIKAEIIAKLGNAEGAICQGWSISAKTINRNAYEVKASSYRQVRKKNLQQMEKAS